MGTGSCTPVAGDTTATRTDQTTLPIGRTFHSGLIALLNLYDPLIPLGHIQAMPYRQ